MLPTVLSSHLPIPHTWEPPQLGPALALCLLQSQTAPMIPSSPNFSQSKAFPNHSNLLQKHLWRGCAWRRIPETFCATSCLESCSLPHRDVPAPGTQLHLLPSEAQVGEFAAGFVGAVGALRRQVLGGDFSTQSLQLRLVTDLSWDKDKTWSPAWQCLSTAVPTTGTHCNSKILLWGLWSGLAIPVNISEAGIPPCPAAGECGKLLQGNRM